MSWFKKRPPIQTTEPYAFEPGKHYVLELSMNDVPSSTDEYLYEWFEKRGIDVAIVPNYGKHRAINPVEATTTTNVDPDRSKMTPPKEQDHE